MADDGEERTAYAVSPKAEALGNATLTETQRRRRPRDKNVGEVALRADGFPELLSVAEVATLLRVSTRTVRRQIKAGALVAHRINRQIRVDAASVTRLLEDSRVGASSRHHVWQNENMSSASRTSSGAEARRSSGRAGSKGGKSRSAPPIESKPSDGSTSSSPRNDARLPQNAAELKEALRKLKHRS